MGAVRGDAEKQDADSDDELGAVAGGALYTAMFLLVAYIPATLIGELVGNRGLPTSPWMVAVTVWPVIAVMLRFEPYLEGFAWWSRSRIDYVWGALLLGQSFVLPIVFAVAWPKSVWPWLPPAVPTILSCVPIACAIWAVKRWHRHLWKTQRPQLGPYRPVPRISSQSSEEP